MDTLKVWLTRMENRKNIPVDQLVVFFNQLDSKAVSIKGAGIFPVTYSFVASVSITQLFVFKKWFKALTI